jgi:hypothetical protein
MNKSIEREALTVQRLHEVLDYNPETGVFVWKFRPDKRKQLNLWFAGKEAGSIEKRRESAYRRIMVDGRLHRAHRLAWLYVKGVWPNHQIDHRDGDGLNNRLENLRDVTDRANHSNQAIPSNNCSEVCGVSWYANYGKWRAQVKKDGRGYHLGYFADLADAEAAVLAKRKALGFSPTHGLTREQRAKLGPEAVAA